MTGTVDTLSLPAKFLSPGDTVNGVPVVATYWEGDDFVVDFGFAAVYGEHTPFTGVKFGAVAA